MPDRLDSGEGRETAAPREATAADAVSMLERVFEAWNADDTEAALEAFDPGVEWRTMEGTYHGLDGLVKHWEEWTEPFDDHRAEAEEFVPAGDRVLVVMRFAGRGKLSGVEVGQRIFHLYSLRNGRVVAMQEYLNRSEALEALERG